MPRFKVQPAALAVGVLSAVLVVVALMAVSCDKANEPEGAESAEATTQGEASAVTHQSGGGQQGGPTAATPDSATPGQINGPNYVVSHPPVELVNGVTGHLELRVAGHSGFKINLEYPWRLTVDEHTLVSVSQPQWDRSGATTFSEDEVIFRIPVSAVEAGEGRIDGHLRFSVCSDSRCDTPREDVAWAVTVGAP